MIFTKYASLLKDAEMNVLYSKSLRANEEIYEELREEGNSNFQAGYFELPIERH